MPKRIQLPDGSWITVPDMDPYLQQLDARGLARYYFGPEEEEEEEDDEGTLAGSAWEGIKSIPSGVADLFYSGLQASIGVATPFADLPVEKRLRRQASKRARERDPVYQDAFLPAVGTGLGQVAGLSTLSRLPGGWYTTMGAGVAMGISEQIRRMADYEQKTGRDVPWYKESAAHFMGALIGLTEVVPIAGMFPAPVRSMMGRMRAGLSPNSFTHASKLEQQFGFRGALGVGLMEATQEASAQWLQALSARGLYDPDAMQDIARAMAEDFKVGGVVGGIAKLVTHQILGAKYRKDNLTAGPEGSLRYRRGRQDRIIRDVEDHITGISDTVSPILRELGVEQQVADDITNIFGGEDAIIPLGFDRVLKTGRITRQEVQQLVEEFELRNAIARFTLDQSVKFHRAAGDNVKAGNYERAKIALDEMIAGRINGLRRTVTELGGRLGEMGGISGMKEYQKVRQEAIESDTDEDVNIVDIQKRRVVAKKRGHKPPSFIQAMRSLMFGSFGVGGGHKMAEEMGVHGGIGSEAISTDVDLDFALASSDQANFDLSQVGEVIFTSSGRNKLSTKERPVDNSDVLDGTLLLAGTEIRETLNGLDEQIEELELDNDRIYRDPAYSFTRELAEIQLNKKFESDEAWRAHRSTTQQNIFKQIRRNNAEISRIKREKSIVYLRLLGGRLREVRDRFINDLESKKKAAKRIFGTTDTNRFDTWLDKTIGSVEQSQRHGEVISEFAEKTREDFLKGMAARTDISEETKSALEAAFLSVNAVRAGLPRDISAPQFIKIANLFIDDPKDADKERSRKRTLQGVLIHQGLGNISDWQVQDELFEVRVGEVPVPNETNVVVKKFIRKLGDDVTDEFGKIILKDGNKESISVEDIEELLRSKNIYLRDGKRIGRGLAKLTGAGVESRPFKKLLFDMTGAPSWKEATYGQRILMYSRLLQLPAHYKSRSNPEDRRYLEGEGKGDYRPLYLPDFYYNPSIDDHVDFLTDRIVEITDRGDAVYPSLTIKTLRDEAGEALGEGFNNESFDEAIARLIEIGVFNRTDSAAPLEIISPETWEARNLEEEDVDAPIDEDYEEAERIALGRGERYFPAMEPETPMSRLTMLSGGARGSDTEWGEIGERFGLQPDKIKHLHAEVHRKPSWRKHLPSINTLLNPVLLAEADVHLDKAAPKLGKVFQGGDTDIANLFRRNWHQIKYLDPKADPVLAIGKWATKRQTKKFPDVGYSVPGRKGRSIVDGGTGWAVQMAIDNGKPVFFFDQIGEQWWSFRHGSPERNIVPGWIKVSTPEIRGKRFAGIGTREINAAGRKAIEDVYIATERRMLDPEKSTVISAEVGEVAPPDARVAMKFKDGAMGMSMRKGLEGKSTMELIEEGVRTGTSRQRKDIKANVGDVVEFYDNGKTIRVVITKGWTKLDQIDPEYWSQIEGWDIAAYNKLADAGYWQYEYELLGRSDIEYDDLSRELTREEEGLSREGTDAVKGLIEEQKRNEYDREAGAVDSSTRVIFNVNYDELGITGVTQPGDQREIDQSLWVQESKPDLLRKLLADEDARWASQVDDIWTSYQEKHPDKLLSRKEFIDIYTPVLTSSAGLQELSDRGILDTIVGAVAMPGGMAPTENILELGTVEGRSLVEGLMKAGALPSSLRDDVQALRRRYLDTIKARFEVLDKNVEEVLTKTRLSSNVKRQYVDDFDGLFQFLGDVAIRGEVIGKDVKAMYDRPGNRIIINLAAIDPNNMVDAQDIVRSAAFHEGLHALFIRDHLTAEELDILYNYVRNSDNVVPEEVDEEAYNAKLTWFERSVVQSADSDLAEGDIEKEAVISLLENLVRNPKVFDARVKGKKIRNVGSGLRIFLEGFVDAAKDANIVDVMRILGRIESGAVGERGAGYLGDVEYSASEMIRSNDLLRYANPEDIKELRAAIVLRDAAPSDAMKASEQARVDDISDKIIANRGIIQESAPPSPDAITALENQRKLIQDSRDTHSGSIPLIGLDQEFKDSEAYKLALDTFMEMRGKDPRYAYKMPAPYQTFFDNKPTIGPRMNQWVLRAVDNETLSATAKDAARQSLEKEGVLSGQKLFNKGEYGLKEDIVYYEGLIRMLENAGVDPAKIEEVKEIVRVHKADIKAGKFPTESPAPETIKATLGGFKKSVDDQVSQLRYNFLDRRQYHVEMTDRLIAAQNRAQLDAETSAIVMWRNSDNAINHLRGLMLRGPLSYLGRSVGAGNFENAPVYDDELQKKYGGDGRIQGLNDIIAPIIDSRDQEAAILYGIAKRVRWTGDRRDSFALVAKDAVSLDPETRLKWQMFEKSYDDIRVSVKEFTDDQLDDIIREVETNESQIVEFWDRYNAYDNHMIKMSYNAGMITREQRDEWLSMPYAPFYRDSDDIEKFPIGSQQELAQRGINLVERSLRKSKKPITTELANSIISNTQALLRDAMMNVAVSRTVRDAVALGEARKINISGMAASVDNSVVRVMEDGIPVFYQFDDIQLAMSTMMLGFNPKRQLQKFFGENKLGNVTQKLLTESSSLLRESVTRTPPFAIKNVFRDSWTAMSLTGGGPGLVLEAFRNAFNVDSLRRADELGLSIGIDFLADPGEYGNQMKRELKKANLDWKNPLNAFSAAWYLSGRISQQSEVATRLAVYDRVLARTGDKALAMHYAIEIMNYGRRGASQTLSTYMSTVPFMNGRLQGMDITYRGLRSKKGSSDIPGIYGYGLTPDEYEGLPMWQKNRQQILGRGAALTFATWALYMLMRDDEEWQDLREEVKSDNWVLPLSDHAWLKIPIPFEVGVLFKVIPEKLFEAITEKDANVGDIGKETRRQMQASLGVAGWPQLFAPIVGAMRNYDAFRKDTIVDHWMEETLSPNEQRNMYTSNVARGIADFANSIPLVKNLDFLTSPQKVEYMSRQYLGTGFSYLVTLADRLARTGLLPDLPYDPYMNLAEAENVVGTNKDFDWKSLVGGEGIVNVPILGDLLTDPRTRGGRQQQFFEMIEELDEILATLSSITDRDRQKGFEYRQKHVNILRHQHHLRSIQNQLREWRERRDHLTRIPSTSMSNDEKRAHYQNLLDNRQDILTSVDSLMASIKQG